MNERQIRSLLQRGSKDTIRLNTGDNCSVSGSKPECNKKKPLGSSIAGKKESMERTLVRFVQFRTRPLDPDNAQGSNKDLLDGLRHAHIIKGDEWWRIEVATKQVKVDHKSQEKTLIQIYA